MRRLLVFSLLFAGTAAAQSVEGTIKAEGAPVPFASVRLAETERGTAADAEGRYRLDLPEAGGFMLLVSAVGHETARVTGTAAEGETVRLDVTLEPVALDPGRVVVTATRTTKALEDIAVPITVVTAEELREQGAVRLSDALESLPGLFLTEDHGTGLQIQGFDPDYTLILLDGEPVIGRTAGTLSLNRIPVAGLERVEIVEGPSSSLYGSEALAGVVNLVTSFPEAGRQVAGTRLRAGSYGETDLVAEGAIGRDNWGARVLFNRYGSNGYDLTPESFGATIPEFADYTADLRTRADLGRTTFSLGARLATQDQSGGYSQGSGADEVRFDDRANRTDWSVHPEVNVRLSDQIGVTGTLYGARYQTETRFTRQSDGAVTFSDDFDQQYGKIEVQANGLWNAEHLTVAGAGVIGERLAGDRYQPNAAGGRPEATQIFAFAQHEWAPSRLLELNASARFDAHSDYAARLSPKVSALLRPTEAVRLRASVGSGFKAPAFRQLYLTFTNAAAGYSVFGSTRLAEGLAGLEADGQIAQQFIDPTTLDPIRSESSIAFNMGTSVDVASWLNVDVGGFWNEVNDLIETQPVAMKSNGQQVFAYFNLAEVYTRGITSTLTARPADGLEVSTSYQFLQARNREIVRGLQEGGVFGRDPDGREYRLTLGDYDGLFGRSPHAATLRTRYRLGALGLSETVAALQGRWRSRYGYADFDGNGIANRPDEFVPATLVLDLTLSHEFALPTGRLAAQLGMDNVLGTTRGTLVPSLPGRTVFASLGFTL
ncbi:MAG: TonB-dependent receptor [Bacteroidota bacterium]